jgi:hypothetical protein
VTLIDRRNEPAAASAFTAAASHRNVRGTPVLARRTRIAVVIAVAAAFAVAAFLVHPIAQPAGYHAFADGRTLLGIRNFWNVVTNLAILAAGIAGLREVATTRGDDATTADATACGVSSRACWLALFAGFVLTAFGSAWYHWAPDSARLVWDRLPMTVAFMSLLAAMIADRIDARAGRILLVPLVALGLASVLWWRWTMTYGREDIGPYAVVQLGGVALVLLVAALFPLRGENRAATAHIVGAGFVYVGAKIVELLDDQIYALGGLMSGHSVKHLLVGVVGIELLLAWRASMRIGVTPAEPSRARRRSATCA